MAILVTGASGFIGRHLIRALLESGPGPVIATAKTLPQPKLPVKFLPVDLRDPSSVKSLIREIRPSQIYHLAGYSSSANSFCEPGISLLENVSIAINLLGAVSALKSPCRTLLLSTVQVYGDTPGGLSENCEPSPANPYAASKLMMEEAANFYYRNRRLDLVLARPGNQIGPGQSPDYVASGFARALAEIEAGKRPARIEAGNLDAARDFLDVRDAAKGCLLLMAQGKSGETYHLSSGNKVQVRELLDRLIELSTVKRSCLKIIISGSRFRPEPKKGRDICIRKIRALGFLPEIPLGNSLRDTLNYWRDRISSASGPGSIELNPAGPEDH